jgi:hypothetical protein
MGTAPAGAAGRLRPGYRDEKTAGWREPGCGAEQRRDVLEMRKVGWNRTNVV